MAATSITMIITFVVGVMVILMSSFCNVNPFAITAKEAWKRAVDLRFYIIILVALYQFNRFSHGTGQEISTRIGTNITGILYALEGGFVANLQALIPSRLTPFFSFVYLFGFGFMLVFPIIAYFVLPSQRYLKELFVAYTINYAIGSLCYIAFIAYGPRKTVNTVSEPMFDRYPEVISFTASINSSANVFPSLHVSFAVTVLLLAWRTRNQYPRWLWIAAIVAVSIVISTMFLGIHWLVDMIAGVILAIGSVRAAIYTVDHLSSTTNA